MLRQKMPAYSQEQDCRTLVSNFYEKYVDQNRPMNLKQKEVFLRSLKAEGTKGSDTFAPIAPSTLSWNFDANKLPIGLKESLKPYPEKMWPALIVGQMPALMALADGVTYRYCDGKTSYLGGMAIILGEQASNKSCIEEAVERWLVDLRHDDELIREREDKVREANRQRKANERAQEAPKGVIRVVPITISCSKLLKRLKQSQGHCLYSICTEAETLLKSNGGGSWRAEDGPRVGHPDISALRLVGIIVYAPTLTGKGISVDVPLLSPRTATVRLQQRLGLGTDGVQTMALRLL